MGNRESYARSQRKVDTCETHRCVTGELIEDEDGAAVDASAEFYQSVGKEGQLSTGRVSTYVCVSREATLKGD